MALGVPKVRTLEERGPRRGPFDARRVLNSLLLAGAGLVAGSMAGCAPAPPLPITDKGVLDAGITDTNTSDDKEKLDMGPADAEHNSSHDGGASDSTRDEFDLGEDMDSGARESTDSAPTDMRADDLDSRPDPTPDSEPDMAPDQHEEDSAPYEDPTDIGPENPSEDAMVADAIPVEDPEEPEEAPPRAQPRPDFSVSFFDLDPVSVEELMDERAVRFGMPFLVPEEGTAWTPVSGIVIEGKTPGGRLVDGMKITIPDIQIESSEPRIEITIDGSRFECEHLLTAPLKVEYFCGIPPEENGGFIFVGENQSVEGLIWVKTGKPASGLDGQITTDPLLFHIDGVIVTTLFRTPFATLRRLPMATEVNGQMPSSPDMTLFLGEGCDVRKTGREVIVTHNPESAEGCRFDTPLFQPGRVMQLATVVGVQVADFIVLANDGQRMALVMNSSNPNTRVRNSYYLGAGTKVLGIQNINGATPENHNPVDIEVEGNYRVGDILEMPTLIGVVQKVIVENVEPIENQDLDQHDGARNFYLHTRQKIRIRPEEGNWIQTPNVNQMISRRPAAMNWTDFPSVTSIPGVLNLQVVEQDELPNEGEFVVINGFRYEVLTGIEADCIGENCKVARLTIHGEGLNQAEGSVYLATPDPSAQSGLKIVENFVAQFWRCEVERISLNYDGVDGTFLHIELNGASDADLYLNPRVTGIKQGVRLQMTSGNRPIEVFGTLVNLRGNDAVVQLAPGSHIFDLERLIVDAEISPVGFAVDADGAASVVLQSLSENRWIPFEDGRFFVLVGHGQAGQGDLDEQAGSTTANTTFELLPPRENFGNPADCRPEYAHSLNNNFAFGGPLGDMPPPGNCSYGDTFLSTGPF